MNLVFWWSNNEYIDYISSRTRRLIKYEIRSGTFIKKNLDDFNEMIKHRKLYIEKRCDQMYGVMLGTINMVEIGECYLEESYKFAADLKKVMRYFERYK